MNGLTPGPYSFFLQSPKTAKHSVSEIRKKPPIVVRSFLELTDRVAQITHSNPQYQVFFRGQSSDHFDGTRGSSLYPKLFRNTGAKLIRSKHELLELAEKLLIRKLERIKFQGKQNLLDFEELRWAILQHYQACETPVLDITASLRVATTFALKSGSPGYVYAVGLPPVNSSISYSIEDGLFNIQLERICPPNAMRPFCQEAYLVGDFPKVKTKTAGCDVARRLLAKFKLVSNRQDLKSFPLIDNDYLFPDNRDLFFRVCADVREGLKTSRMSLLGLGP